MKRRPAHTPPVLAPTAYRCAAAVLGAVLYLVAVQTGSDACMAGALAILLSHIVSLDVALSAFLDEKWRGKAERTHRAARMVHRIARASADRRERITYKRIDQMGRVVATLTLGLPPRERGVYQESDKLVTTTGPLMAVALEHTHHHGWRAFAPARQRGCKRCRGRSRACAARPRRAGRQRARHLVGAPLPTRRPNERNRLAPDRPPRQAHVI